MKKHTSRLFLAWLLTLLVLGVVGNFITFTNIPKAHASPDMLPSDSDAWTENNNATYTWTVSPSYKDDMVFTTQDKVVGSYSLNVNHTTTAAYMAFGLDIGSSFDLTSYDVVVFRFKMVRSGGWTGSLYFYTGNTGLFAGDRHKVTLRSDANRWIKIVIPLDAFVVHSGSPDWNAKRYFDIMLSGVTSGDNARVYIDGMYFSTWETITETVSVDETMLPNYDSFIKRWQKSAIYNGVSYISVRSMVPTSGSTFGYETLESEALSQVIFGYMYAYNYSRHEYYLDESKQYVNWLLQFQSINSSDAGHGGFYEWFNNNSKSFVGPIKDTYNGWILAGLSWYYHFTSDQTVKTAVDRLAGFLMDTLWDNTNKWYDTSYDITAHTVTDATSWQPMPQGSIALGLSLYYNFVTQNSTAQTQVNALLNKGLTSDSPDHKYYLQKRVFEDNVYAWWGEYFAYKAFSNITYYNDALDVIKLMRSNYEINGNGSVYYNIHFTEYEHFDGWGFACALPLVFTLYEKIGDDNYLELFENNILELTPAIETGNYSITRFRGSGDQWETYQYLPSNAFIVGALNAYYSKIYKPTNPYILTTDKEITSSSYGNDKLIFTVSTTNFAGVTSTTMVYCGDKGEPTTVQATNGTLTWSYNASTTILTLNVSHTGPANILVDWRIPGDVDSDGDIDLDDLYYVLIGYGMTIEDAMAIYGVPPDTDIDGDGTVDLDDLYYVLRDYGYP